MVNSRFAADIEECLNALIAFMIEWKTPPLKPSLEDGQVHIWKIRLNFQTDCLNTQYTLSTDEQNRAEKLISPEKRYRFISARAALRKILSIYTEQSPEKIQIKYFINGKPYLPHIYSSPGLEFNISHSKDLMIAGFTTTGAVGVDLEYDQFIGSKHQILNNYFSENDQTAYIDLGEEQKNSAFISAWTRKEAFGKATGSGLTSPDQLDHLQPGDNQLLPINHAEMVQQKPFWSLLFKPDMDYTAALAIISRKKPECVFWETSVNELIYPG